MDSKVCEEGNCQFIHRFPSVLEVRMIGQVGSPGADV